MNNTLRTILIPAALAPLARALAAGLSAAGAGMFVRAMGKTADGPATFYVSSGLIGEDFATLIADADLLHAACLKAGAQVSLAQCQLLVSQSVVSDGYFEGLDGQQVAEDPFALFTRLGLVFSERAA